MGCWSRFNPLHCGAVVASSAGTLLSARVWRWFQSPSLRGSGRFGKTHNLNNLNNLRFQSPSLRGSGRFDKIGTDVPPQIIGFNPLHCGAVVASASVQTSGVLNIEVSIPFIAGQWSLQGAGRGLRRGGARVSIPFIAGQWSLPSKDVQVFVQA